MVDDKKYMEENTRMDIEINKFVSDMCEKVRQENAKPFPKEYIDALLDDLGKTTINEIYCNDCDCVHKHPLHYLIDVEKLREAIERIITGARASVIYDYELFIAVYLQSMELK